MLALLGIAWHCLNKIEQKIIHDKFVFDSKFLIWVYIMCPLTSGVCTEIMVKLPTLDELKTFLTYTHHI